MKKSYNKAIMVVIFLFVTVYINEEYFKKEYINLAEELRLLDHFVAAICITSICYFLINKFYISCIFYVVWSTEWEIQQFMKKGYFQIEQYSTDLLGVFVVILIYNSKKLRKEGTKCSNMMN